MQTTTRIIALLGLAAGTLAVGACTNRTDRIEHRQDVRTTGAEVRQDRYDARYQGRQDRRQLRSDRADARYSTW
jgi:hypothetical protein